MSDELLKDAFSKVKQDIFYLGEEISNLKSELIDIKTEFKLISSILDDMRIKNLEFESKFYQFQQTNQQTNTPTLAFKEIPTHNSSVPEADYSIPTHNPTIQHITPAQTPIPTDTPTLPQEAGGLIAPYKPISIGNEGVPTDTPTNRQTNQQTGLSSTSSRSSHLDRASEILADLDSLRKEVRLKFKRLTPQEMQVFSLLYSLEDSGILVDYRVLSSRLSLSESSIRDYVLKLQKKGIPITKEKLNNKRIILHVSQDLRKIATLSTIIQLREL